MTSPAKQVALLALAAALTGCGGRKQHLSAEHGRSYDAAFAAQRARDEPTAAATGFDSQEAAIVSEGYRAGLAPQGQKVAIPQVLLVPPTGPERVQPLAPSVPKER